MIETRVFDLQPDAGVTKLFHYDHATDDFHIETIMDCTDLVEQNKAMSNESVGLGHGEFNKIASVPMALYFDLKKQGIIGDQDRLRAWLNDRDNRLFRTRLGKV